MKNFCNLTIIFLICHFLGDFHLQCHTLSKLKVKDNKYLLKHIVIVSSTLIYPLIIGTINNIIVPILISILIIIITHYLIDYIKVKISSKIMSMNNIDDNIRDSGGKIIEENKKATEVNIRRKYLLEKLTNKEGLFFIIDQGLHIAIIILIGEILFKRDFLTINPILFSRDYLNAILIVLLLTKPSNILFKLAFNKFSINKEPNEETETGAGAIIGNLERILSVIFLSMGQSSAIGLIYTAKSIARFKQIEENKRFAEYYLIGTLYSILYAILIYLVVLK